MEKYAAREQFVQLEALMPIFREQFEKGDTVRFSPRGISMRPMLREGIDSVVLSPLPEKLKKFDLPLYQRDDGKYVLHRVVRVCEGYSCAGDNQFVLEHGLRHDQMIAVVTAFYRGDRKIETDSPLYWCYCRVWHYSRPFRHFWRRGIGWIRRHLK